MGGGNDRTSKTTNEPWSGAKPYLTQGYQAAEQNILNRPTEFFPGSTVVPFAPESEAALGATATRAVEGSPVLGAAQDYTSRVLGGEYLSPEKNPFMRGLVDSVTSAVRPGIDASFAGAGRGGSPGHREALGRGISRGLMPYLYGDYGRERGFMEGAAGRAPGLAREDYYDIGQLGRVGAAREGKAGEELADSMARYGFAQEEPGRRAQSYISSISGIPMPMSSTTRTSGGGSGVMDALSLGLLGAGMVGGFPTAGGGSLGGNFLNKTVICTALYRAGLLDKFTMQQADAWGARHPVVADGYRLWATPIARRMGADPAFCQRVYRLAMPLIRRLAQGGPDWSPAGITLGLGVAGCWAIGWALRQFVPFRFSKPSQPATDF